VKTAAKPTDILSAEHRVIETVLDALEKIAQAARKERLLAIEPAKQALRFLRTFADTCHHGKEEQRLFPMLYARGMPREVGPVAMMIGEHESGRRLIQDMVLALGGAEQNQAGAALRFAEAATSYVELLREHISKEDHVLFPMAEGMLRDEDRDQLFAAFDKVEHEELGIGLHREMEEIAASLAARYGVKPASDRGLRPGACCGHRHDEQ
jgi:hemerythrin-like domain-containing protein